MLRDTCPELASSDELWKVRLPSGDRTMTLDELDAAFEAGHLDTDTLVCAPGSSEFQRLGAAAGLDPEPEAPVAIVPRPMNSMSPMVLSQEPPSYVRLPMPSLDLGDAPFQKKFSKKLLAIPAGLAVLAAIIGIAASASASSATLAAAGEAAKTEMVAPSPPSPAVTAPPATTEAPAAAPPSLTDGQKKLLAMKDKKVEAATKAKRALTAPPAKHMSMSKGKSSAPFTKGGNPHDPLNGAI